MAYISFQPQDYFNTVLYQSNSGSAQSITGVGFQPDFLWVKDRTAGGGHVLVDAVRGSTKWLGSHSTSAEVTRADQVTSFDSDGFSLGADSGGFINYSTNNNVSWNWKANGAGVSNTDGSITSTVSASTTSGMSIVKWTGSGSNATIGHGLGVAPSVIITKSLASTQEWCFGSDALGWGNYLFLNETSASQSGSTYWQSTAPTSNVFSVGTAGPTNSSSGDLIAYCFAEKKGFSKFGSYTGNGNADGPMIYTGFKPAMIFLKNASDGAKNWEIIDNRRPSTGQNPADDILFPDTSDPEASSQTDRLVDFVSNGVKIRGNSGQLNGNGNTFIYACFAEEPLVSSNGIPNTAR